MNLLSRKGRSFIYGINTIPSTIKSCYKWNFTIFADQDTLNIEIGICAISESDMMKFEPLVANASVYYGYDGKCGYFKDKYDNAIELRSITTSKPFTSGDKLSMYLDLNRKELKFIKNKKNKKAVIFRNIKYGSDIQYRLIVRALCREEAVIKIDHFEKI